MLMLWFIFATVCGIFGGGESVYAIFFICLDLGIKFIIPLTGLILPHFVCRIYARTWISISICPGIFGVQ
jgi:hypothetical protein